MVYEEKQLIEIYNQLKEKSLPIDTIKYFYYNYSDNYYDLPNLGYRLFDFSKDDDNIKTMKHIVDAANSCGNFLFFRETYECFEWWNNNIHKFLGKNISLRYSYE